MEPDAPRSPSPAACSPSEHTATPSSAKADDAEQATGDGRAAGPILSVYRLSIPLTLTAAEWGALADDLEREMYTRDDLRAEGEAIGLTIAAYHRAIGVCRTRRNRLTPRPPHSRLAIGHPEEGARAEVNRWDEEEA